MTEAELSRRDAALDEAAQLFLRFGYRKTSMDDIARAAGVSRQALYLWFPNKEALFRAMVDRLLASIDAGIDAALLAKAPLPSRLLDAFAAFNGMFVEMNASADRLGELFETTTRLLGDRIDAFEAAFVSRLEQTLVAERLSEPVDRVFVLLQASYGLKHKADDMAAYREGMRRAIDVVCR